MGKNYDEQFIHRKLKGKVKRIESGEFRVGQVTFHNQKLLLIVRDWTREQKEKEMEEEEVEDEDVDVRGMTFGDEMESFEEVFEGLPERVMAESGSRSGGRDVITVRIVS